MAISWSGGFDSEGMYCDMAIRFNNGDKLHEVPCTILADGTKRYTKWESQLGSKASHGCIRVARLPNDDGLDQTWLWNNLKRMTKIIIWDDGGANCLTRTMICCYITTLTAENITIPRRSAPR